MTPAQDPKTEPKLPAHELIYRGLRARIMQGQMAPGQALTLRRIAADFDVSMTPAREAARRLVAEGALTLSSSGRISTPMLSNERLEELTALRAMLEPELASRALPRAHAALIERLSLLNSAVNEMIVKADPTGYIRTNIEFHRALYLRAQAPAMLAVVETVWLQAGPTLAQLYGRRNMDLSENHHRSILAALAAGDEPGLRIAVRSDVSRGLRMLMS